MDRNYYADKDADWVRVALRKESVDRNLYLSSFALALAVALRKESVDRNGEVLNLDRWLAGRSPQGERG